RFSRDWSSDVCSSDLNEDKRWYGVQFHPEVTHTLQGQTLLRRFVTDVCGCATLWTAAHIIDDQIARVRDLVGSDEVVLGLSGGEIGRASCRERVWSCV